MKLITPHTTATRRNRPGRQRGFIMIALLVIVTLMLLYIAASSQTVYALQRDLTALERAQVKRLANSPAVLPTPVAATTAAVAPSPAGP